MKRLQSSVSAFRVNLRSLYQNRTIATFTALGFASAASFVMVLARVLYTGEKTYLFLLWNLFLAWIPFLIALSIYSGRIRSRPLVLLAAAVWLLFFPNAPYIITDFVHLRYQQGAPIWYDATLIASFAWTGLFLGLVSLRMMQSLVRNRFGSTVGWCMALGVLLLSSFGVYLGRYQRWNSWDIISNPGALALDILDKVLHPLSHPSVVGMTVIFALFMLVAYVITSTLFAEPSERDNTR